MSSKSEQETSTKELFFNNIAHEFRTPLSLILGPSEQLIEELENPVHQQKLKMVWRNAVYLKQLIDQLLALAKIEDGHSKVNLSNVNCYQFFNEITSSFDALAEIKSVKYIYNIEKLNCVNWKDTVKIKIILSNLISNAIKFTSEKGEVDIRVYPVNDCIRFRITDTGIGIAESKIPHVFDRYYQEDRHVKHYIGTGIGLALCKELADELKATLWVESVAGEGSTFFLDIPHYESKAEAKKAHPEAEFIENEIREEDVPVVIESQATYEIDETTEEPVILIVEDNDDIRKLLKESISDYKVIEASNGVQGSELALRYIPRIVITDLMMPDMDGFELIEVLRGDFRTNHIPVVVISALNEVQHRLDALKKGASAFIAKPFNLTEVRLQVDNLLSLQNQDQEQKFETLLTNQNDWRDSDKEFIELLKKTIDDHLDEEHFGVENLSQTIGISRVQLHRKLKAIAGCTASSFIKRYKMSMASTMLMSNKFSISEISFKLGFSSAAHFSRSFKEVFDHSPKKYKELSKQV